MMALVVALGGDHTRTLAGYFAQTADLARAQQRLEIHRKMPRFENGYYYLDQAMARPLLRISSA
jgi:hypothetical protein